MTEPDSKVPRMTKAQPDLAKFKLERVLHNIPNTKTLYLLGSFNGHEGQAILSMNRQHFNVEESERCANSTVLKDELHYNDIYYKFTAEARPEDSRTLVDIIWPCTARHIAKYDSQGVSMLCETADIYKAVTKPYVDSIDMSRNQWVYNILDGTAEADRVIFDAPGDTAGFVVLPDNKWDRKQIEQLYCLAIIRNRSLRSLRNLRQEHLPMLRQLRDAAVPAVAQKYGIPRTSLRCYFHYYPSYYQLHVHIVHAKLDMGFGMAAGKGHMLDDVIANIELFPDFYEKCSIATQVGHSDPLHPLLVAHSSAASKAV